MSGVPGGNPSLTPAELFLSGFEEDDELHVLTNEDFELLAGATANSWQDEKEQGSEKVEDARSSKAAVPQKKRVRRSTAEIESYIEKHAQRRRVSAEEMRQFLASRKRFKRAPLPPQIVPVPVPVPPSEASVFATIRASPTYERDIGIWRKMCHLLSSYDLHGLQDWLATSFSPHVFLRVVDSNLEPMFGPIAMALLLCTGLGVFPVYNMSRARIFELDSATHVSLLDEVKRRCSPEFAKSLELGNTICYKFVSQFDGVRIFLLSIWEIMQNYTMKHPALFKHGGELGLPLRGQEVRDLLFATDERGLFSDFDRIKAQDLNTHSDGYTVLEVRNVILADASTRVVLGCVTDVATLVCPELESLHLEDAKPQREADTTEQKTDSSF